MKFIEVAISPTGDVKVQTKGFADSEFQQASKYIEQTLGIAQNDRLTSEFFQSTETHQEVKQ